MVALVDNKRVLRDRGGIDLIGVQEVHELRLNARRCRRTRREADVISSGTGSGLVYINQ